eukprot:TRINITY_DN14298_c0_g1_i2.p1 TRINITY_DN14298_c0_g1~~TRINITY_DN14298_c0_g1_i2.p1  ORF type:complete len:479 (+),score=84.79 TRINITY_DN14298_c0_g1_i2:104-1540(+)
MFPIASAMGERCAWTLVTMDACVMISIQNVCGVVVSEAHGALMNPWPKDSNRSLALIAKPPILPLSAGRAPSPPPLAPGKIPKLAKAAKAEEPREYPKQRRTSGDSRNSELSRLFLSWEKADHDPDDDDSDSNSSMDFSPERSPVGCDGRRAMGLQLTPYDATVLSLTALWDRNFRYMRGKDAIGMLLVSSLVIHAVNITVQMILIFSLLATTIRDESKPYRDTDNLRAAIAALRDAVSSGVSLEDYDRASLTNGQEQAMQFCELMKTLPWSHTAVIFLWFTRMIQEWMDALRRFYYVMSLDWANSSEDEELIWINKATGSGNDKYLIYRTTLTIQIIFCIFVSLPQFVVAFFLSWAGAKYLFFTHDMGTLVMKAISLSFIIQVDELMFLSFGSLRFKEQVKNTGYIVDASGNEHWDLWGMSAVKIGAAVLVTYWVSHEAFRDVVSLRHLCALNKRRDDFTLAGSWRDFLGQLPFAGA